MAALQLEVPPDVTAPVVVGCSGGADSLALLALAVDGGLAPIAVHVDHGLRAGSDREAGNVAQAAARSGAGFDARAGDRGARAQPRGSGARCSVRRARGGPRGARRDRGARRPTPPTTRPRRCCSTCCGGAARPGWRACRPAAGTSCDRCSACGGQTCEPNAHAGELTPWEDPSNDDLAFRRNWIRHEVLPLLERGAGRDLTPLLTRQADVLRAESDFLDALAARRGPARAGPGRAISPRSPTRWRGVRSGAGWAHRRRRSTRSTPSSPSRGERRAVELAGGRRVHRSAGVLHAVDATTGALPPSAEPELATAPLG